MKSEIKLWIFHELEKFEWNRISVRQRYDICCKDLGYEVNKSTFDRAVSKVYTKFMKPKLPKNDTYINNKRILPSKNDVDEQETYEDIYNAGTVLVIGDMHIPFTRPDYLDFCNEQYIKHKCDTVVFIGDVLDMHTLSYHEHDPNGFSPDEEFELAIKMLKPWYETFPNAYVCIGNHDSLISRKAKTHGLPQRLFKTLKEVIEAPIGWKFNYSWQIDGVKYMHGTGGGGGTAHRMRALKNRQSTVLGHFHTCLSVDYLASHHDVIFGMAVGCGININAYAMEYGRDFVDRPLLGCGVVYNKNRAVAIPMEIR